MKEAHLKCQRDIRADLGELLNCLYFTKSPPLLSVGGGVGGGERERENLSGAPADEQSVFERKEVLKKERERVERHCCL